jgi:predicted dehydrogenase
MLTKSFLHREIVMSKSSHHRSHRLFICATTIAVSTLCIAAVRAAEEIRLGIIGLDTSHAIAFTELLNATNAPAELAGCRVVVAYPPGSADIPSSVQRVPEYTERIQKLGVEIVPSIEALLSRVDGVLLETNDGRPHREQARRVLQARKPLFIDKPLAASLADALAIFDEAKKAGVPVFSCSALRFSESIQGARNGSAGRVLGCDAVSPCSLEATHPDLFWYGIHGVETLFTVMGPGCQRVTRMTSPGTDFVVGQWKDGRIGSYRGVREGQGTYGATVFGSEASRSLGGFDGYRPLVVEIVKFFRTGVAPIDPQETIEIYAFMEAADESKRRQGAPVELSEVIRAAKSASGQ